MKKLILLSLMFLLHACSDVSGGNDDNAETDPGTTPPQSNDTVLAVVATVASDYSSGAHSLISQDAGGELFALNNLKATDSDISIAAYGRYFYRIGMAGAGNSITKFAIDDPQSVIWQFSVNDPVSDPASAVVANPHAMVFVSETKAYVFRYNKTKAWIVNPSATRESEFKTGELDLSAYGGSDGIPDMDSAVVANGKLYIAVQRLEGALYQPDNVSYLAVFDTATDQEIDVGITGDSLKGIPLLARNPTDIFYDESSDRIFVLGSGSTLPPLKYVGGIETVDATTYVTTLQLDDGDDSDHPYGIFYQMALSPPDKLFFVGYSGWQDNTLYEMNLSTKEVKPTMVTQLINGDIADITVDAYGRLWVADNASAAIRFIDTATGSERDVLSTGLNPVKIILLP